MPHQRSGLAPLKRAAAREEIRARLDRDAILSVEHGVGDLLGYQFPDLAWVEARVRYRDDG